MARTTSGQVTSSARCKRATTSHQEQGQRPRAHRAQEVLQVGPPHTSTRRPASEPIRAPGSSTTGSTVLEAARGTGAFDDWSGTYATYTLAYRLTGDEEDARDVVQESYLRAYRGLRAFRGDAQFSTWLYRITANCASTHLGAPAAPPARRARRRRRRGRRPGPRSTRRLVPTRWPCATARGRPRRAARHGCGPSWCCATSTTCPTRRSPPSSASPSRRPRCGCTGPGAGCASRCSPVATPATVDGGSAHAV